MFLNSSSAACNSCHSLTPEEVFVGPSLAGIGSRQDALTIARSITDPSVEIAAGFPTHLVFTTDGKTIVGRLLVENDQVVVLQLESGADVTVLRSQIEGMKLMGSQMPEDAASGFSPQDLADLVAFLSSLEEPDPLASPPPE